MPHAVVRPDMLYAWSGPSLLVVTRAGAALETAVRAISQAIADPVSPFD
jgi:hypothetical protein